MLIIARTDARQSEGLDGALARAQLYGEAGADVLFVEALTSRDEMRKANAVLTRPSMANMANGGLTPMCSARELAELGYAFAIYPSMTSLIAAAAMEAALLRLKRDGDGEPADIAMFDFKEMCSLIGFEDVWEFEKIWARTPPQVPPQRT
jgi:2-methylisocitrate lyase-like PEP mutase family enzyme